MENISEFHDQKLKELPVELREKGVQVLRGILTLQDSDQIRISFSEDPVTWWASSHHGWGTRIRNLLRGMVCKDGDLPSKNWDDYYIALVEIAVGVRQRPE